MALGVLATALLAAAPPASAHGVILGFTWYDDGQLVKSGASGTVITAFATSARRNTQYTLRIAPSRPDSGCQDTGATDVNPAIRTSNGNGFIPNTSGPVNRSPGEYDICFYEIPASARASATATYPVFFTVV